MPIQKSMIGKPLWPIFGLPPLDIFKHGIVFLLNINSILSHIQNNDSQPLATMETLLKDTIAYLEKVKEEKRQKEILEAVQIVFFKATQHQQRMEENFTIVKSFYSKGNIPQAQSSKSPNTTCTKTYAS